MAKRRYKSGIVKFPDNCGACGNEYLKNELTKIALSGLSWELNICKACLKTDPLSNYQDVIRIIDNVDTESKYREAVGFLNRRQKMSNLKTPPELDEAAKKLEKEYNINVGTGYGLRNIYDNPEDAQWMIFAYVKNPKKMADILPHKYHGFYVQVRGFASTMW